MWRAIDNIIVILFSSHPHSVELKFLFFVTTATATMLPSAMLIVANVSARLSGEWKVSGPEAGKREESEEDELGTKYDVNDY